MAESIVIPTTTDASISEEMQFMITYIYIYLYNYEQPYVILVSRRRVIMKKGMYVHVGENNTSHWVDLKNI